MRTRSGVAALVAVSLIWLLMAAPTPRAQGSPLLAAMQDELQRSMAGLRLKDEPPPYYIDYEVDDVVETNLQGKLGAIVEDGSRRIRVLQVDVRVGDYAFDSSRFISGNRGAPSGGTVIPIDDDYDALRREIWLATDIAYKRAVTVFARKNAAFQNRSGKESLPDFSKERSVEMVLPVPGPPPQNREWIDGLRRISGVFTSSPHLDSSDVSLTETRGTRYYVNSEGSKVIAPIQSASLRVGAETQADDGAALFDGFSVVENRMEDMPSVSELVTRTRELAERLTARRTAPIGEEYTGPVLVEGQASAELVAQRLVPLMLARRPPDADTARATQLAQSQVTPFLTRIGLRVLSDAFSVSDTPSLVRHEGRPVPGAYAVDNEGVPAKDVALVENGKLLTLLTGRTPQKKLLQSNGHGRSGGPEAGVFQVRSAQAVPFSDLKKKYLELLAVQDKPFGYIVRQIGTFSGPGAAGPAIIEIARVTPEGAEMPVRGLRFAAIGPTTFRNILDASEERVLYNYIVGAGDTVSTIVPSMVYEELEIQQTKDIVQKPPIVPSPLKD